MSPLTFALLPAEVVWTEPSADSRAPRSSVAVRLVGGPGVDAVLALPLPIVELTNSSLRLQVGLSSAVFLGFAAEGDLVFDFETFDGWFALPIDVAVGPWSARLELAHLSAHYGDGVRDNSVRPGNFDPYSREWVRLWGARTLGPARLYASAWALVHSLPEASPFGASIGADVEGPWRVAPFGGVDLRVAQEDGWSPALGGAVGARLLEGPHCLKLGFTARYGPEDTGKARPADEAWISFGLAYERR